MARTFCAIRPRRMEATITTPSTKRCHGLNSLGISAKPIRVLSPGSVGESDITRSARRNNAELELSQPPHGSAAYRRLHRSRGKSISYDRQ